MIFRSSRRDIVALHPPWIDIASVVYVGVDFAANRLASDRAD